MAAANIMAAADIAAAILFRVVGLMALFPDCNTPGLLPACSAPVISD
jgi:hypothetical protein